MWVEVPSIAAGSTTDTIWMYYDNAAATGAQDRPVKPIVIQTIKIERRA